MEFVLLRSCLTLPKITYILRTVDPTFHCQLWEEYDEITKGELERILGAPVTGDVWEQAKLKVNDGGLGLRSALDHGIAAYTASKLGTQDLVGTILGTDIREQKPLGHEIVQKLRGALGITVENLGGYNQKALSVKIDKRNAHLYFTRLDREGDDREKARSKALTLQHAGAWLNVVPNPKMGHYLNSQEFAVCLKYRLGLDIYPVNTACSECSSRERREGLQGGVTVMDTKGEAALNCRYGGGWIFRHNAIRDAIAAAAASASMQPRVEAEGLVRGNKERPGDITLPGYPRGTDSALDVTVVNPLQHKYQAQSAVNKGAAMEGRKREKHVKYAGKLEANVVLRPMVFETLGGWDDDAVVMVKNITAIQARNQGQDEKDQARQVVQKVAMAIQKGNTSILIAQMPGTEPDLVAGEIPSL